MTKEMTNEHYLTLWRREQIETKQHAALSPHTRSKHREKTTEPREEKYTVQTTCDNEHDLICYVHQNEYDFMFYVHKEMHNLSFLVQGDGDELNLSFNVHKEIQHLIFHAQE